MIRAFDVAYFMISVDTLADNTAFAKQESADFSKFGLGEVANRWTFYIGGDGKILDIDTKVNPAKSGEEVVAHMTALKMPRK
jgi:peroxiredoxin